ncbi:MAG: hypothetical protein QJT81_08715 [Candidatus Thiothrix putei]|uniref:Uncharacterized protein n=1 Tax=Candidatus Thiothrix putei TaxID=3080811 RepID=A0AA95HH81_9GAMM|nr:MAG: hypothetical protein QJT81_08715 [Candidatus Thiothrix putei]
MNSTERALIAQRWSLLQIEVLPCFNDAFGTLTPKLEKLIHVLELTRIEDFVRSFRDGSGRPATERSWFANAFVAKSVLNIVNTRALIDRLQNDRVTVHGTAPLKRQEIQ